MQVPWFLATTPAPRRPAAPARRPLRSWWSRLGERLVAWGDRAHHHRMGSWMRR
ncbi:hypothetical protein [Piscinibacter sp. XHJ-5]|uniref:hypothetical protein n=1 Tax=Piscinibacter sp. XHJ-5 TaxID=3037797 RepID=UPI002452D114|nr:hypothetical protein [Piscinibacter sp. XHJ-5]